MIFKTHQLYDMLCEQCFLSLNQNRTKKQRKLITQIVLSIYASDDKPFESDVAKYHNEFLLGIREIYNMDTGEVYNRSDFMHNGEPITVSDSMVRNIINDPLNRKVVDRIRNDFQYNQNRHNADVQRVAPYNSLSKITFDDRDMRRKAIVSRVNKITGKTERYEAQLHAYYAFDVASGVCVGAAYSLKKDKELVVECVRDMWANLRRWNLLNPWEFEVENHLIKGTELEDKFRNTCIKWKILSYGKKARKIIYQNRKTMITAKQQRRLYRLHYQLRKRGNKVNARQRFVTKRAKELSPIEQKYITELIAMQYCVCDDMFT